MDHAMTDKPRARCSCLPDTAAQALLCMLLLCGLPAAAEEFVEWVGANSGVNWSNGEIRAEGAGVAPDGMPASRAKLFACRAAVIDAQRNLLESIKGVRVEGSTVVANMMVESDVIKTSVSGVLQGGRVVKREVDPDGGCIVTMTAPLGGKFTQDVYGEVFQETAWFVPNRLRSGADRLLSTIVGGTLDMLVPVAHAADDAQAPDWKTSVDALATRITGIEQLLATHPAVVEKTDAGPTGLVIDARGSNFIPSMSPRIRQLRAGVIYPSPAHQVSRRDRGQLVSLFTRELDTARRHPAVGDRPVVMKGLRTFGKTRTEVVLGTESSERLVGLIKQGFLDDSGVIIVL